MLEGSDHCSYCLGARNDPYASRCYDSIGGKHYIYLNYCEIASMRDWLWNIGERNRLMIRNVRLSFSGSQYTKVLGEYHPGGKPRKPCPVGGDLLENALKLLARAHNLETFGISLQIPSNDFTVYQTDARLRALSEAFNQLFAVGSKRRLMNALSAIRGIKNFDCTELDEFYMLGKPEGGEMNILEDARAGLGEVKSLTESDHAAHQKLEVPYPWSADIYVDQAERLARDPSNVAEWLATAPSSAKRIPESLKRSH